MAKTGSTSIQAAFRDYGSDRLTYARFGDANHSLPANTVFQERPWQLPNHRVLGRTEAEVRELGRRWRAELESSVRGTELDLLFSGEGIVLLEKDGLERFRDLLTANGIRDFRVYAYIREPESMASSQFQQRLKKGLAEFVVPRTRYRENFEKFFDVFGRDRVALRAFDRRSLKDGCVVADFASWIGVDGFSWHGQHENSSMSAEAAGLILARNKLPHRGNRRDGFLKAVRGTVKTLTVWFPGRFAFAPELVPDPGVRESFDWLVETAGLQFLSPPKRTDDVVRSEAHLLEIVDRAFPILIEHLEAAGVWRRGDPRHPIDALIDACMRSGGPIAGA